MPLNSKFFAKFISKKIVKTGLYLVKILSKCNSLLFGPPCRFAKTCLSFIRNWNRAQLPFPPLLGSSFPLL